MKQLKSFLFFLTCLIVILDSSLAQKDNAAFSSDQFKAKGEVYFSFMINNKADIQILSSFISIDKVDGDLIYAYANEKEFRKFLSLNYPYTLLPHPGDLLDPIELRPPGSGKGALNTWDYYPTYEEYLTIMDDFVAAFPELCQLEFIGYTTQNRELIAVKISDNVTAEEGEPQFLYSSSMHGDETTGYPMMLHLIDHLLSGYGSDPRITNMINSLEIFICPLANPDGTYWGGNASVYGAKRYNANNVDLNRNYPDPEDGPHPDGEEWQPETVAFMDFASANHFVMGANFHGGEEVVNYPWDTWAKLAADDAWWQFVSHEYADTARFYSPAYYFSGFNNGITNGYAWYTISGGRQDYMNYFRNCREVTIEISDTKLLPANQLLTYWGYNYRSLLNFLEQAMYGVQGVVTDSVTGEPLQARVFIPGHDIDNSYVNTKLPSGFYSRYLWEGDYSIQFSASGYFAKTIEDVGVNNYNTTLLDVQLVPLNIGIPPSSVTHQPIVYPNPACHKVAIHAAATEGKSVLVVLLNIRGNEILRREYIQPLSGKADLLLEGVAPGLYLLKVSSPEEVVYTEKLLIL